MAFLQKLLDHVSSLVEVQHTGPHIWQETPLDRDLALSLATFVQAWCPAALSAIMEKGYRTKVGLAKTGTLRVSAFSTYP